MAPPASAYPAGPAAPSPFLPGAPVPANAPARPRPTSSAPFEVPPPWSDPFPAPQAQVPPIARPAPVPAANRPPVPHRETEKLELDLARAPRRPSPSQVRRPQPTGAKNAPSKRRRDRQSVVATGVRLTLCITALAAVLVWLDARIHWNRGLQELVGSLPQQGYDPRLFAVIVTAIFGAPLLGWLLRWLDLLFPGERGLLAILGSSILGALCVTASLFLTIALWCVFVRIASTPAPLLDAILALRGAGIRAAWKDALPLVRDAWQIIAGSGAGFGVLCAVLAPRRK